MVRKAKKIKKKTPSGRHVIRRGRKKPSTAKCAMCGGKLHGVPKQRPSKLQKIPASKRKPNRPYGGNLCSKCMRKKFTRKVIFLED